MDKQAKPGNEDFFAAYRQRLGEQVSEQMARIEMARTRIHAGSQALTSGLLASLPPAESDNANRRIGSMSNAMDEVLSRMQQQAVSDITEVMHQHQGLRQLQHEMARRQYAEQGLASQSPVNSETIIDGEIVAEAKTESPSDQVSIKTDPA